MVDSLILLLLLLLLRSLLVLLVLVLVLVKEMLLVKLLGIARQPEAEGKIRGTLIIFSVHGIFNYLWFSSCPFIIIRKPICRW
jgi:hypothetical protein